MAKKFPYKTLSACLFLALGIHAEENKTENKKKENQEVEIIEVKGVRLADRKARGMERDSDVYSSVISTDDLGNLVDQNVAESLRRLPGVVLERNEGEGTHVAIRGLGANFVAVTMNGAEMAGVGDDRKVGLDGISGDSLGAIEVFKTLTPEMNLNSIGGMVNVKSISAFDKGKDTFKFKLQNSYQELSQQHSPKLSFDGTTLLFDEVIGLGFAAGYENRATHVEELRQHPTREMHFRQADLGLVDGKAVKVEPTGPIILAPNELDKRLEDAERERKNATLNIEFRPSDSHSFYLRGNYSSYSDNDIALREKYAFSAANPLSYSPEQEGEEIPFLEKQPSYFGETAYVNGETKEFILTDVDVQNQYFIQEGTNVTKSFSAGGEHYIGDATVLDYEYAVSESVSEIKDGRRAQFRERDLIVYGQGLKDGINTRVLTAQEAADISGLDIAVFDGANNSDTRGDVTSLANFNLDNIFLEFNAPFVRRLGICLIAG